MVARVIRTAVAVTALLLAGASVRAQAPVRTEAGAISRSADAVARAGGYVFPATLADAFSGSVRVSGDGAVLRIFGDTVRFWNGSPFFRSGTRVYQLAASAALINGALQLPEQFFIQWLPARFPDSLEYRGGVLRLRSRPAAAAVNAPPASSTAGVTPARPRAGNPLGSPAGVPAGSRRIVILDPGHGGVDPGSSGPNGLKEKDVALMVTNRLAALLRTRGYEVHLTRTRDTLISLDDRPRFANRWKGDEPGALYMSIHMNALKSSSARGFETFFLSEAGTEDERRVAEMENAAVKYEARPTKPAGELDQVLNELRNDFYLRASNDLAAVVQQRLAAFHSGPNRGVKRARFRVLVGALMPAVLVEVGFITNPTEARLLGSSSFQDKVAFGLADSVDRFFRENEHLWVRSQ